MPRNFASNEAQGAHAYRCESDPVEIGPRDEAKCDLYFLRMEDSLQPIKIGMSFASGKRQRILQCGSPYPLALLGVLFCEGKFEADWHQRFDNLRMLGEWFNPAPELHEAIAVALKEGSRKALGIPEPVDTWRDLLGITALKSG